MLGDNTKFTIEEIRLLLNKYNDLLADSNTSNQDIRYKIISLERELDKFMKGMELKHTPITTMASTNVKILTRDLIHKLGYTQNTIFIHEAEYLTNIICKSVEWNILHGENNNDELATCIVGEVLDYYKSKYDVNDLINILDIDTKKFVRLSIKCHEWCKRNYWIR